MFKPRHQQWLMGAYGSADAVASAPMASSLWNPSRDSWGDLVTGTQGFSGVQGWTQTGLLGQQPTVNNDSEFVLDRWLLFPTPTASPLSEDFPFHTFPLVEGVLEEGVLDEYGQPAGPASVNPSLEGSPGISFAVERWLATSEVSTLATIESNDVEEESMGDG